MRQRSREVMAGRFGGGWELPAGWGEESFDAFGDGLTRYCPTEETEITLERKDSLSRTVAGIPHAEQKTTLPWRKETLAIEKYRL